MLYKYELLLTLQSRFKVVRVPVGLKRTISTRLEADHCKCDVPHQIGEKVFDAIYVEAPLNQVDAI